MTVPRTEIGAPWLLLTFTLPTKRASQRVEIWRKLQRYGAVPLGNSGYLLPNSPTNQERFEWLAAAVRKYAGEASVVKEASRSEEHTSELQSPYELVCRLLLEKKNIVVILIVVGVGIYILTRPPGTTTNGTPVSIFDAHPLCSQVTPANCGFSPSTLTVKIGTNNTVTWTNNGGQAHTVTYNQTANGSLPSFNSNGINANQQYTFTFTQAGTYHYYCEYHVWMEAVVVVSA